MLDDGDGYVSGFPDDGLALLAFRLDRGEWEAETEPDAVAEDVLSVAAETVAAAIGAGGVQFAVVMGETLVVNASLHCGGVAPGWLVDWSSSTSFSIWASLVTTSS